MGELNSLPIACPKPEANDSMTLPIFKNQRAVGDIHEQLILFITNAKYSVRVWIGHDVMHSVKCLWFEHYSPWCCQYPKN